VVDVSRSLPAIREDIHGLLAIGSSHLPPLPKTGGIRSLLHQCPGASCRPRVKNKAGTGSGPSRPCWQAAPFPSKNPAKGGGDVEAAKEHEWKGPRIRPCGCRNSTTSNSLISRATHSRLDRHSPLENGELWSCSSSRNWGDVLARPGKFQVCLSASWRLALRSRTTIRSPAAATGRTGMSTTRPFTVT